MLVDIKGLPKEEVLRAFYNASRPQGLGMLHFVEGDMSIEEAKETLEKLSPHLYFDYLKGRVMKLDLTKDEIETRNYDRDIGEGRGAEVIAKLREELERPKLTEEDIGSGMLNILRLRRLGEFDGVRLILQRFTEIAGADKTTEAMEELTKEESEETSEEDNYDLLFSEVKHVCTLVDTVNPEKAEWLVKEIANTQANLDAAEEEFGRWGVHLFRGMVKEAGLMLEDKVLIWPLSKRAGELLGLLKKAREEDDLVKLEALDAEFSALFDGLEGKAKSERGKQIFGEVARTLQIKRMLSGARKDGTLQKMFASILGIDPSELDIPGEDQPGR